MRMIYSIVLVMFVTSCTEQNAPTKSKNYHDKLERDCKENSCCLASVKHMRKGNYKLAIDGLCPPSMNPNMMKCISSYKWCEPMDIDGPTKK